MTQPINVYPRVSKAVDALIEDRGSAYTAGFLVSQLVYVIDMLPKHKQEQFLAAMEHVVDDVVCPLHR